MLLERNTQLAILRDQFDAAAKKMGSVVLIAGEAGAGKTTLVNAFTSALDSSALVIAGACDPLSTPRPLSPLYDFAADPNAGLSNLFDEGRDTFGVFDEILARLNQTIRPIVMIIEDVHWADEATLDLLRFVGRRVADTKSIVICTYRDDEIGVDHPLRPVLGQLLPLSTTVRVEVPLLSFDAVEELAAEHDIDALGLYRLTDGNAFFVTEVLSTGEGLPSSVNDAVIARVGLLDDRSREVVEGVSIAPRSLSIEDATALVGGGPKEIDRALSVGVLVGEGNALRFRHELARSAVEDSLPPARRLHLHQQMLQNLSAAASPDIARLAHHAIAAGNVPMVLRYAPEAARLSERQGARKEAISFYRGALAHTDALDLETEAELRTSLGRQLSVTEHSQEAAEQHAIATDLYRRIGDPLQLGRALIVQARAIWRINRRAEESEQEAFSILEPLGPTGELAEAFYTRGYRMMLARMGEVARNAVDRARELVEIVGTGELRWNVKMLDGTVHIVLGDEQRGIELLDESIAEADRDDNLRQLSLALGMLGSGGGEARVYERAIAALRRGIDQGLATDEDHGVAYNRSWMARIAFEQGRWDDAVEYAQLVDRTSIDRTGISVLTALSALGRVRVRRGDPGGIQLLEQMLEIGADHELQHVWNAFCGYAEHHWLRGQGERAIEGLEPAYRRALETTSRWARGEIGFWMWRIGAIDGPPEGAASPFALQMSGDWRAAAKAWEVIGCPYERAMALADGDETARLEALQTLDLLGARPLADRVRFQLRDGGASHVPRARRAGATPDTADLTERQSEVLGLMAEGLSNEEIAERLYISRKTVEHHASAIYAKLGVSSRSKAVAVWRSL